MNKLIKVIIADRDEEFRSILKDSLESEHDIRVIAVTENGIEAAALARSGNADVIITDIILAGLDGLGVLERISRQSSVRRTASIVISAFDSSSIIRKATSFGAMFYLSKPVDISLISERVRQAAGAPKCASGCMDASSNRKMELECIATDILRDIGIPAHVKGYWYLREAVLMASDDIELIGAMTKELYPSVAKRFDSTAVRVERAIRNAIEIAWTRGDIDTIEKYFGYTVSSCKGKPTNGEFIALVADILRLEFKQRGFAV